MVDFNLIQIPEVITDKEAKDLIYYFRTHKHLCSSDNNPQYDGRKIQLENIKTQWIRDIIRRLEYMIVSEVAQYGAKVFPEQSEICCQPVGGEITPHKDVYDVRIYPHLKTEEYQTYVPQSEWAAVLYLNSSGTDYKGGNLRFTPCEMIPMGFEYVPQAREIVVFQGMEFEHSVTKVYHGDRYTLPMWFTTDFKDIRPELPNP